MQNRRAFVFLAVAAGVVLLALAVVYWVDSASALPSWLPGHEAGSSHHHVKHGLAAALLGLGCLVLAWFQSGPRRAEGRSTHPPHRSAG
jgi:hypothetical protein